MFFYDNNETNERMNKKVDQLALKNYKSIFIMNNELEIVIQRCCKVVIKVVKISF